jgi:DNA polymerase I
MPADSAPVHELFDVLEFKALRERVKPLLVVGEKAVESSMPAEARESLELEGSAIAIRGERIARASTLGTEVGIVAEFKTWLADESAKKITHNAKLLMHTLSAYQISGIYRDTAISAYLVNPGQKVEDLSELCERYLGYPVETGSDELALDLDGTDGPLIAEAEAILALAAVLEPEIMKAGLAELDNTLEMPLTSLLYRMESVGIAVSQTELAKLSSTFAGIAQRATEDGAAMVGHDVNLASPKQLQVVLFEELNLPKTKKNKTGYTTDSDAIDWLRTQSNHPFLEIIRTHRDYSKLKSIVEGLERATAEDGRIHTTLAQTVTSTGRLSSVDPNLQNIPVRTEEGRKIRAAFIAGKGFESLLTADYSQIEMRIMAHLSHDAGLIAAFASGEDLHTTVACQVFGVDAKEVTPEMRRQIKAMSYGLAYGLSAYGLAGQLGIADGEARNLMETYFERFGGVRDYLKEVVVEARKKGYTETLLGRKRFLPDLASDNRQRREMAERMALNAPIQGTAADIVKLAMLAVDRELTTAKAKSRLLLQVHDELIIEVAPGEADLVKEIVIREMESAYPLDVTLDVNVGVGKNWDEGAH